MVLKINPLKYSCPFCGKKLESRFSKCFNIYCQGQKFNVSNLVIYRLNPNLGIGRVIRRLEIPTSKSLDEDDTHFITKFKVSFRNNIIKIIHPIDLIHYIFQEEDKIKTAPSGICQIEVFRVYKVLGNITIELTEYLKGQGYKSEAHHPFGGKLLDGPHVVAANLGIMGRNGLIITPEFGP
ncbi:unnamed protein product, partial [marine sediment metagenome]